MGTAVLLFIALYDPSAVFMPDRNQNLCFLREAVGEFPGMFSSVVIGEGNYISVIFRRTNDKLAQLGVLNRLRGDGHLLAIMRNDDI